MNKKNAYVPWVDQFFHLLLFQYFQNDGSLFDDEVISDVL